MIRPTMSHAANREEFYKLLGDYATQLEEENSKLREELSANRVVNRSLSCLIPDLQEENTNLREQLKKAEAERDELKKESLAFRSVAEQPLTFHEDSDAMYVSGFTNAIRLFEDIYLGEPHHELKKRDIEQQIKALEDFQSEFDAQNDYWGNTPMAYIGDLRTRIEHLRKELEK